jgi:hypothetical protein
MEGEIWVLEFKVLECLGKFRMFRLFTVNEQITEILILYSISVPKED